MDRTIIKPFKEIEYKIYGYTLPEVPSHDGYVKIGDTTRDAATRVFEQVGTAGLNPNILFEKLARKSDGKWFRDKELHRYFKMNGIERKDFNGRADEWFYFNGTLERAEHLTNKFIERDYEVIQIADNKFNYVLRNEQQQAVEKTLEYYHSEDEEMEFLWNAKPRFGKTLTTFDFIRNLQTTNVLIVTNRPAIANSWFDDFQKFIAWQEPHKKFVSETDALSGKAMTRDQYLDHLDTTTHENPSQIAFISLQDLKGAKFAGGRYEKLDWVAGLDWDLLVIDEAHEGIDTKKTDRAFSKIKRKFTLHLSGTPFKALANNKFHEEQIFNWSYIDEQQAKEEWDETIGSNPYESLPTLNLFTYQMSKMIEDEVTAGLQIEDETNIDYAFDLNEFFRVKDNGKFEYEESVIRFLDNLSSGKFPFCEDQYRNELNHTFWLLPRVNAAKALEELLKEHSTFKEYAVVLAAGDGVSIQENLEEEALDMKKNAKSFDKVRESIQKHDKTITLSVGQLTTGVTIPEWTAVFMLNNIESPSLYFQAAFRSQNPYEFEQEGKLYRKESAYIFDFSPDRTLRLYDEFANNLTSGSSKTSSERKSKIKKLLNFFPVIAEDEDGSMHEINASEVLAIPTHITSREVVKRGFMSNLLFANIAGVFSGDSPFKEILDKIPPEKNKRLEKPREVEITDPYLDEEGEVEIPKEVVLGKSKDIFGDKIYAPIEVVEEVTKSIDEAEENQKESIKTLAENITKSFADGFDKFKDDFKLTKGRADDIKKSVHTSLEEMITDKHLTMANEVRELKRDYEHKRDEAISENNEEELQVATKQYEEKKKEIETTFLDEINKEVEETIHTVVEEQIEKVEEKKKKATEDDVRDHLRGFARTIPAFLMAYGDEETTLANFDENIDEATFEDLTSITIDEFKKLRDGFEYVDDSGSEKSIPGLFNEVVFNASIREFLDTRERLANYFDESLEDDIFDYIPPQKTNQIFTPRYIVKYMVDELEKQNPDIFSNPNFKYIDLYTKSGLFLAELVKKLNIGLKKEIPDQNQRIKWILEKQLYACAPSDIISNIAKNYVYGEFSEISDGNIANIDLTKHVENGTALTRIKEFFGDDDLKFDVVIGNPPYQEEMLKKESKHGQKPVKNIFHHFQIEGEKLASEYTVLIYPGGRWIHRSGKGLSNFGYNQINDPHLSKVIFYPDSEEVFSGVGIPDGISIVVKDFSKNSNEFEYVYKLNGREIKVKINSPGDDIIPLNPEDLKIIKKTDDFVLRNDLDYLFNSIFPRSLFQIESNFAENNPSKVELYHGQEIDCSKSIKLYTNDKAGKMGRANWFVADKDVIKVNQELVSEWQVVVSSANAGGQKRDNQISIIDNNSAFGRSRLALKSFKTEEEAQNFKKYCQSYLVRFTFLMTDESLSSLAKKVPDLLDYSNENEFIDFSEDLDSQLFKLFNLDEEQVDYVIKKVNNIRQ
ncbi:Eco57I restriction-modification methylase domain-containing protein [Alkalicoccus luteus]|uniref:Eco57I restriction-modification methylase domain-containing protein n=1 Tax=Alkalicoccus luteus TaxID=1237094 RepID=UPI004034B73F